MSLGQELSELITRFESFSLFVAQRQQQPEMQATNAGFIQKQAIEALIIASIPLLRELKEAEEEFLDLKAKCSNLEQTQDNTALQIKSLRDHLHHSRQTIIELSQQQQQLKLQNEHLQSMIANVQAQYESKHLEQTSTIRTLEVENSKLREHIRELNVKVVDLQNKNREISNSRQQLKEQLQHYINLESTLEKTLLGLKEQYEGLTSTLRQEIQQKQLHIQQLQESKTSNLKQEELPQPLIYQQFGWRDHQYDQCFEDVPTEEKLVKLSEQFTLQENRLIHLQSINSIEGSERQLEKQQLLKALDETDRSMLRKVTSSIDFYGRRKSLLITSLEAVKNSEIPTKITLRQLESAEHLNDMQDISQIDRPQKPDINTETQITEGEQALVTEQKKIPIEMDPYYIHYLLIVQNIKIEEDQEGIYGILDIDMKPFFWELKGLGLGISKWPQWVRERLLTIHQSLP